MNREFVREVGLLPFLVGGLRRKLGKWSGSGNRVRLPNGHTLWLPPQSAFGSEVCIASPRVDWGSEGILRQLHRPGTAFVDAGANIGYYSMFMVDVADRVFAFEPDPRAKQWLETNFRDSLSVSISACALSDNCGSGHLDMESEPAVSRLVPTQSSTSIDVKVSTLDRLLASYDGKLGSIKTDCEGHDIHVLRGGLSLIRRDRPIILTEQVMGQDIQDFALDIHYVPFAVCRSDGKLTFSRQHSRSQGRIKMLFLCPEERAEECHRVAYQCLHQQ